MSQIRVQRRTSSYDEYFDNIYTTPFVYRGIVWPDYTNVDILQKCEKFEFRPDDIIVATYPRSGTTLTQEIVWQIVNHEIVKKNETYGSVSKRFPFLEFNTKIMKDRIPPGTPIPVDMLEQQTSQRLVKTHLPYSFIRDQIEKVNPKIIVVMRNPKDNVVSCYNIFKGLLQLKDEISFSDFWQAYIAGKMINGDFCDFNLEYWSLRDRENVLMVRYEDLLYQPFQEIRKIAMFLGYSLSAEKVAAIVHNTTFDVMSKNEAINTPLRDGVMKFMRKGKVGDWKDWLTVTQNEAMDVWISDRLSGAGLQFTYE